ncbi:MAG: methionyl-tRNA formyltransferase [Candidatus Methylacidiphilales bacterium]|nr:methionyl-tRNA formyltransferase [Candidatus Methylacidiphilales bacterium]
MRVVFVGTGEIGVPSYRALVSAPGIHLVGVVTQPDRPAGRKLEPTPSPVKRAVAGSGVVLLQPEKINRPEVIEELRALVPDVLVVCAYGQILKPAVLELPRMGCLNLHASLLPRHRGASCIQAAILAGDARTGMTVMWMDAGLDTGDILLQEAFPMGRRATAGALHDRLAAQAPGLLLRALSLVREGRAPRLPQDAGLATYAPKLSKADGRLDWSRPLCEIDRRVRAMSPWPSAYTYFEDHGQRRLLKVFRIILCRKVRGRPGEILRVGKEGVWVGAGDGGILLREVQMEGRARMPAADFARGQKLMPGMIFD